MSYEPTLIISRDDLRRAAAVIEQVEDKPAKKKPSATVLKMREANHALYCALPLEGFKIKDIWLIIIKPEGTLHNAAVREMLSNLDIDYAIDY